MLLIDNSQRYWPAPQQLEAGRQCDIEPLRDRAHVLGGRDVASGAGLGGYIGDLKIW